MRVEASDDQYGHSYSGRLGQDTVIAFPCNPNPNPRDKTLKSFSDTCRMYFRWFGVLFHLLQYLDEVRLDQVDGRNLGDKAVEGGDGGLLDFRRDGLLGEKKRHRLNCIHLH